MHPSCLVSRWRPVCYPTTDVIYLTFEGPISGDRGSVRRVAEGVFQTIEWRVDHVRVQLSGAQLVGEVDLYRSPSGTDSKGGSTTWTFLLGKVD